MNPHVYLGLLKSQKNKYVNEKILAKQLEIALDIRAVVCHEFAISIENIESRSRKHVFIIPRFVAMFIIRGETRLTLEQIGELFGNRDHSTVDNAINVIDDYLTTDKFFKANFNEVNKAVQEKLKQIRTLNQQ